MDVRSLRDLDPEYDGSCPCAFGEVGGVAVSVCCWRTGPQPAGISVSIDWLAEGSPPARVVLDQVVSLVRVSWPHEIFLYVDGKKAGFIPHA